MSRFICFSVRVDWKLEDFDLFLCFYFYTVFGLVLVNCTRFMDRCFIPIKRFVIKYSCLRNWEFYDFFLNIKFYLGSNLNFID